MGTSPTLDRWTQQKTLALSVNVSATARQEAIKRKVDEYSIWYPRATSLLMTSNGQAIQDLPASLAKSIRMYGAVAKCLLGIEHPVDQATGPDVWNPSEYVLLPRWTTKPHQIGFQGVIPSSGETLRLLVQLAHFDQLTAPDGVAVAFFGTGSGTTWGYEVTALDDHGETLPSAAVTASGPAALSSSNYMRVTWTVDFDAHVGGFKIYRTVPTAGLIGTVAAGVAAFNDTGGAAGAAHPLINTAECTIDRGLWGKVSSGCAMECNLIDATAHANTVASGTTVGAETLGVIDARIKLVEQWRKDWESLIPPEGVVGMMVSECGGRDNPFGAPIFGENDEAGYRRTR